MKKYILLSFLLSINLRSAHYETNLLILPEELIYYIFNFISYKTSYKNIILSSRFYDYMYNYLMYDQNILLSQKNISENDKKQIVFNNRLLLGYLRKDGKEALQDEEKITKEWHHGVLKYLFKNNQYQIFYVPKDTDKKLYTICSTDRKYFLLNNTLFDFLEWNYPENPEKDFENFVHLTNLKTNKQVIRFPYPLLHRFVLSTSFKSVLKQTPYVTLLFSHPTILCLPGDFNKLHIVGPIKEIYFDKKMDSLEYSSSKRREKEKSSLSLQLGVTEKTDTDCFKDIKTLSHVKKLIISFDKDSCPNSTFNIQCPPH